MWSACPSFSAWEARGRWVIGLRAAGNPGEGPPDGSERYNTIFTPTRINVTASTVRSRRSGTWALA